MAAYGIPETDIATVVEIDPKTLRRHYRKELDTGHIKANTKVAESLFRKAMGDGPQSVTACIFWLKTRAHWKETTVQEHVGNAGPIMKIERVIISPPPRDSNSNMLGPPAAKGPPLLEHVGT